MRLCRCSRRTFLAAAGLAAFAARTNAAPAEHRTFIAEAFRMRDEAVRAGAKVLYCTHHEPTRSDDALEAAYRQALTDHPVPPGGPEVRLAYEGHVYEF